MTASSHRPTSAALALLAASAFVTAPALADDLPGNSARIGLYSVFFHVSADDLSGPYVPPGANIDAKNVETLYLAYVRSLSAHFDVELTLGYPPLQKTVGKGPATLGSVPYDGQVIATARWIAPTLLLEYDFLGENSQWRPYVGAGVNYTTFYDRDSTAAGNAASGGPTKLSLTSSVGPAVTAGVNYHITGNWHFYGSYSWSQVKTDLTADTAGVIRTTRISFGPQALVLSVGYSF
ncbi:MAG TPA: OmpW family outer membrane protein [Steroidobacteraceae bacterium]|nr:OmpW family outer membrane protein [Steroidobacteraceae bacterium]